MTIFSGSRYLENDLINGVTPEGEAIRVHPLRKTTNTDPDGLIEYITKAGDTFESIAYKFYGDANKWYAIADVNPGIFWPLDLKAGIKISVPSMIRVGAS